MHENSATDLRVSRLALPPLRGLVPLQNRAGRWFSIREAHRALRHQCLAFGVLKADLCFSAAPPEGLVESCLAFARELQVAISIRVPAALMLHSLASWRELGLAGICLTGDPARLEAALTECRKAGLPLRIESGQPFSGIAPKVLRDGGVRLVTLFAAEPPPQLRGRLEAEGIALAVYPDADPQACAALLRQPPDPYFSDHQQYHRGAYEHGCSLMVLSPRRARARLILDALALTGIATPSDRRLVHFLRIRTPCFDAVQTAARAMRHLIPPRDQVNTASSHEASSALAYYDEVDIARLDSTTRLESLAREALQWKGASAPDAIFESGDWGFENAFHDPMPGVNQLHVLLPGEKRGTKLPFLKLPFMVSVTVGGGMADSVGFAIGRYIRIACPMVATSHQLTLYAAADGSYVLLRDGHAVLPEALGGTAYTPARLPEGAHLQLAVWNPEASLSATALEVWSTVPSFEKQRDFEVSVLLFSTRFSRRLQAALSCIAHQRGIALEKIQCIIALVPGLDAAEDVLDSVRRVYPALSIEAVALPERFAHAKGFALNECLARAIGPLTVLIDSDILLPPDFLTESVTASRGHAFIAPAGRAMLGPDETARILMGVLAPWEHFDELREGAPDFRVEENPEQVPIGYCQVFPTETGRTVRYPEYDHFQGADYEFGAALRERLGVPFRLPLPVLHLDHGTRQWFGAQKQF